MAGRNDVSSFRPIHEMAWWLLISCAAPEAAHERDAPRVSLTCHFGVELKPFYSMKTRTRHSKWTFILNARWAVYGSNSYIWLSRLIALGGAGLLTWRQKRSRSPFRNIL